MAREYLYPIFVSFRFSDPDSQNMFDYVRRAIQSLPGATDHTGKSIHTLDDFAGEIEDFIRDKASLVIAILSSGSNENVVFEVGVAVGANKRVLLVARDVRHLPPMLARRNAIIQANYENMLVELTRAIEPNLPLVEVPASKMRRRYFRDEIERFRDYSSIQSIAYMIHEAELSQAEGAIRQRLQEVGPRPYAGHPDLAFLAAEVHYLIALEAQDQKEKDKNNKRAAHIVEEALARSPRSSLLLNAKGRILRRLGELDDARKCLEACIAQDPGFSTPNYDLACLLALRDDKNEENRALFLLKKATEGESKWREYAALDPDWRAFRSNSLWRDIVYRRG